MKASSRLLIKIDIDPILASSSYFKALEKLGSSLRGKINLTVFAADC
jgi:hypothetical protein